MHCRSATTGSSTLGEYGLWSRRRAAYPKSNFVFRTGRLDRLVDRQKSGLLRVASSLPQEKSDQKPVHIAVHLDSLN